MTLIRMGTHQVIWQDLYDSQGNVECFDKPVSTTNLLLVKTRLCCDEMMSNRLSYASVQYKNVFKNCYIFSIFFNVIFVSNFCLFIWNVYDT